MVSASLKRRLNYFYLQPTEYWLGDAATRLVGKIEEFVGLSDEDKTSLKWRHFIQPVKVWLVILLPNVDRSRSSTVILNWEPVGFDELAKDTPIPPIQ